MNSEIFTKNEHGFVEWTHEDGDSYIVTGTLTNKKRFRIKTTSWAHARAINVYRGSKWLVRDGKRYKIQSIFN